MSKITWVRHWNSLTNVCFECDEEEPLRAWLVHLQEDTWTILDNYPCVIAENGEIGINDLPEIINHSPFHVIYVGRGRKIVEYVLEFTYSEYREQQWFAPGGLLPGLVPK